MTGRLKPEEIINPNNLNAAVVPLTAPAPAAVRRFVCPQCGGKLSFSPKKQAMACEYCGYQGEGEDANAHGSALTAGQDFTSALYTARAHRWEIPTERILSCQACGAHFTLPPSRVTGECPFCGSAHIVKSDEGAELIEPDGVIPFQFDEQGAIGRLRQWLAVQLPSKNNLKQAAFARPRPVYFPFWVFNMNGELTWRGMVPQYRRDANVLVWVPRDGSALAMMDNLLVAASHSLPAALVDALGASAAAGGGSFAGQDASSVQHRGAADSESAAGEQRASSPQHRGAADSESAANGQFDWSALAHYEANYLADWPAEIYQISLADASLVARGRAFEDAKRRASPGPEIQHLTYHSLGISIDTYRLVLLPIWVSEFHLKDKICPLVVNGQSGAVYGSLPRGGLGGLLSGLLG